MRHHETSGEPLPPARPASSPTESGLDQTEVLAWLTRMGTGTEETGLAQCTGAQLCDLLTSLELAKNAAAAAQARVSVTAADTLRQESLDRGVAPSRADQGISAQVALARRESPHAGSRHLGLARAVTQEMPHLHAAMTAGTVAEWTATKIVRTTACLCREHRTAVDAHLAGRYATDSCRALVAAAEAKAYELDPYAFTQRGRRAAADRRVSIRPAPDVMSLVSGYLPAATGVACYASLDQAARSLKAQGDPRSLDQLRADLFSERLTGVAATHSPPVELGLVMTDRAATGATEEAAHLVGYGPVPAPYARDLLHGGSPRGHPAAGGEDSPGTPDPAPAPAGEERAQAEAAVQWLRRLYADPVTGVLTTQDTRRRRFPEGMRRFLIARDQACSTPWCDAPIRHADHVRPWAQGGETTPDNADGLCAGCNYAKETPGWRNEKVTLPDGTRATKITTPTGHTYFSTPPPVLSALAPEDAPARDPDDPARDPDDPTRDPDDPSRGPDDPSRDPNGAAHKPEAGAGPADSHGPHHPLAS